MRDITVFYFQIHHVYWSIVHLLAVASICFVSTLPTSIGVNVDVTLVICSFLLFNYVNILSFNHFFWTFWSYWNHGTAVNCSFLCKSTKLDVMKSSVTKKTYCTALSCENVFLIFDVKIFVCEINTLYRYPTSVKNNLKWSCD